LDTYIFQSFASPFLLIFKVLSLYKNYGATQTAPFIIITVSIEILIYSSSYAIVGVKMRMLKLSLLLILLIFLVGCATSEIPAEQMMDMEESMPLQVSKGTQYTRDISNLEEAKTTEILTPKENEVIELSADIITKEINGKKIRMFGYNGQIPGPLFKVEQGQRVTINFKNNLDVETTIHWHGLRQDNKFDGVPFVNQDPVKPRETFTYKVKFPDEGIYWYHPHVREDYQQELGLYGNLLVIPEKEAYYNEVNQEELLVLDDILIEGDIVPFYEEYIDRVLMGRFGNVMLINGETEYNLELEKGSVVRFFITNVASTRMFNISIPGAKLKVVGSDIGNYEKEFKTDSVIISPAERYIVEAYFENEGEYKIKHINPDKTYPLGTIKVSDKHVIKDYSEEFLINRRNEYVIEDISNYREYFNKDLDAELILTLEMESIPGMEMMKGDSEEKIEWEEERSTMNTKSTNETLTWKLVDKATGKENMGINYEWKVGDIIKLRIFNDPKSKHPMQHPIHLHGQRFLVLEQDGIKNDNLVWKDTVLVPKGSYVDILIDVTNPGDWMAHCHISEHLQAGMMTLIKVTS